MALWMRRTILVAAGLLGAIGVMSAAMASHGEAIRNLAAISAMALAHAPVLLILALAGRGRALLTAGVLLALGCAVFIADLAMRQWVGNALFPGAAPLGGGALILGWVVTAISAAFQRTLND
jgi:uncharacterized membrane protein YgdD (TMEM256/DUF423 family)